VTAARQKFDKQPGKSLKKREKKREKGKRRSPNEIPEKIVNQNPMIDSPNPVPIACQTKNTK